MSRRIFDVSSVFAVTSGWAIERKGLRWRRQKIKIASVAFENLLQVRMRFNEYIERRLTISNAADEERKSAERGNRCWNSASREVGNRQTEVGDIQYVLNSVIFYASALICRRTTMWLIIDTLSMLIVSTDHAIKTNYVYVSFYSSQLIRIILLYT